MRWGAKLLPAPLANLPTAGPQWSGLLTISAMRLARGFYQFVALVGPGLLPARLLGLVNSLLRGIGPGLVNAVAGRLAVNWLTRLAGEFASFRSAELVFGLGVRRWFGLLRRLVAALQAIRGRTWRQSCARLLLQGLPRACHSRGRRAVTDDRVDGGGVVSKKTASLNQRLMVPIIQANLAVTYY